MEPLISNYTQNGVHRPRLAKPFFHPGYNRKRSNFIVAPDSNSNGINERIFNLLNDFEKLKDNWDADDAKAPGQKAIEISKKLTTVFQSLGQKIYHAAPGPNGEVMLDLRNHDHKKSIEIIVYEHEILIVRIPEEGLPDQEIYNRNRITDYLSWLNK